VDSVVHLIYINIKQYYVQLFLGVHTLVKIEKNNVTIVTNL